MDEATLERHLHLTMTLIGGFMGGYAILNRHDVFGSAQTGNMISLAMDAVGHPDEQWFFRVLALVIYIVSMAATVVISHKISKINQKRLSILIDGAVLLILRILSQGNESVCCIVSDIFCYCFSVVFF